jgi:hypothetical protein
MMIEPLSAVIGTLAFGLHLYGKYGERTALQPFMPWVRDNVGYILSSIALCAIGLLAQVDIMEAIGMTKAPIYAAVLCYGGGHAVSRIIGLREANKERKAKVEPVV